jgi:hypothetical protein
LVFGAVGAPEQPAPTNAAKRPRRHEARFMPRL